MMKDRMPILLALVLGLIVAPLAAAQSAREGDQHRAGDRLFAPLVAACRQ